MVITKCDGWACVCPIEPSHYADCFVVWPWIALLLIAAAALVSFMFQIRYIFFKVSPTVSATKRLQRQNTFWILMFSSFSTGLLLKLIFYRDLSSLIPWCVMLIITGTGYIVWLFSKKR
jgi:hypothetical protein